KYKSKAHHQDQRKYYNMVNKALKDDEKKKVFWDFEEPKFKKKSFFESNDKYLEYIQEELKKKNAENRKTMNQNFADAEKNREILAIRTEELKSENTKLRQKLGLVAGHNFDEKQFIAFLDNQKKHQAENERKQRHQKNHSGPSPSYEPS
ncbi:hypothetical protein, partial [Halomonas shantousis]